MRTESFLPLKQSLATDNMVEYRYSQKNILIDRCHYMYTPYEGPGFLKAYLAQRQTLQHTLERTHQGLLNDSDPNMAFSKEIYQAVSANSTEHVSKLLRSSMLEVLPERPGACDFITRSVLMDLWQIYLHSPAQDIQTCSEWIEVFLKKFEVSKRLYVSYDTKLKPKVRQYDQLENYALLAGLLIYRYRSTSNLKYLNATLKLVDLLASVGVDRESPLIQLVMLATIEAEVVAVQALLAKHGIEL